MTVWVLGCDDIHFDASTQTCAVPVYVPQTSGLPMLSEADAQLLGMKIAVLWATAYVFRLLRKALH